MAIREDSWLSERFGHPLFTVGEPSRDAAELRRHCAGGERASYQARVDVGDVKTLGALTDTGMRLVNVSVTLQHQSAAALAAVARVEVRELDAASDTALLDVAERSFRYTRFHLDPGVPQGVADRIKRDWVWSYLHGLRGSALLVAVLEGEPVGFLAVLTREEDGRRVGVIDLVGVAPEARGAGAGTALVSRFHEWCASRCDRVEVGTQLANTPAIAFYERLGYRTSCSAFDLHMHVG